MSRDTGGSEHCIGCESEAEYRLEYEWADPTEPLCGSCLQNVIANFTRAFRWEPDAPDTTKLQIHRVSNRDSRDTDKDQTDA